MNKPSQHHGGSIHTSFVLFFAIFFRYQHAVGLLRKELAERVRYRSAEKKQERPPRKSMSILRTLIRKQTVLSVGRRLCHGYRDPGSEFDSSGSSSDTRAEVRRARSVTSQTCAEAYCKCLAASQPCYEAPAPSLVRHAKAAVGDRV